MSVTYDISLGANIVEKESCRFLVWAPHAQRVDLELHTSRSRTVSLTPLERGYFGGHIERAPAGTMYSYHLDGGESRPDPASHFQPRGVHGPSQIVDHQFPWTDQCWYGRPLQEYVLYELHVGTFTTAGTFDAIIERLGELKDLGVTAIELMPVAQFPGERNWGYDGVQPFAVQNSYGGPDGLRKLVNACHHSGFAVVLDVVFNHLGPEGNYLAEFGHYFTDRYNTPWGPAINFDDAHSDDVRRFFIENALHWFRHYHIDALRLDAVHAIFDESAQPFLSELTEAVQREAENSNRRLYLFEENDKNDPRHVFPAEIGGYGLDAVWNDDFHHSLHALLTEERDGYYADFGSLNHLAQAYRDGFVYSGQYSKFRQRRHGKSSAEVPAHRLIVCSQNHDQVGNRLKGERLSQLTTFEQLKLAAGTVLLAPRIPLLFMGEEYGETAPFLYFVSHGDQELVEAVRQGRKAEFSAFSWQENIPDPQSKKSFQRSKLNHALKHSGNHGYLLEFYRKLLSLRQQIPALKLISKEQTTVEYCEGEQVLLCHRQCGLSQTLAIYTFACFPVTFTTTLPAGVWNKILDSTEKRWNGNGSNLPFSFTGTEPTTLQLPPTACALFERNHT